MANKIQLIIEADDQASSQFKKMVTGLERGFSSLDSETKKLTRSSTQLGNTLKWAGGFLATYFGARAIGGITRGVIDTGAGFEKMRIQLDTLTRGRGQETLDSLNQWAKDMPVNTEKAVEAFIRMKAMGLEPTIADMTTLVDTTSALGGDSGTLEGISRALGQIQTKGKVSSEELLQLAERGVPAYRILQEQLNLTAEQVANIGNEGISGTTAVRALIRGLAQEFGGQSKRMQETWAGMVEALRSEWVDFNKMVAEAGGLESAKAAVGGLLDTVRQLSDEGTLQIWAEAISNVMSTVIGAVDGAILAFNDLFNTGLQTQIDDTREKIEKVQQAISEGGLWAQAADGADVLVKSTEELKLELFYLNQELLSLIGKQQDARRGHDELKTGTDDAKASTDEMTTSLKEQAQVWKDLDASVKAWNERYNEFKEQIGEEREQVGQYGKPFGVDTLFPSLEEWDEAREIYDENLNAIRESTETNYNGMSAATKKYLDDLVKETEKNEKKMTKVSYAEGQIRLQYQQAVAGAALTIARAALADSIELQLALIAIETGVKYWLAVAAAHLASAEALAHPPGPPTTVPIAAAAYATGMAAAHGVLIAGAAAAAAAVISEKKQKGGWLKGGSGQRDDLYIGTVGQTAYLAQGGEFIVNRRAAEENAGLLEAINEGRAVGGMSGADTIHITLHNYMVLEREVLSQETKQIIYQGTKAGEPIVHTRGIVTP